MRLVKEAVDLYLIEERDDLYYQTNESKPYSGWVKVMYDSGQVQGLSRLKDGKSDGPSTMWHENGQKQDESTWKDDEPDGPWTAWHENGQKQVEGTWKDGEEVFAKYWNSKGEEVETAEEARK